MNHPRILRWLRISFSAFCLLACVLLIALWVRSYWKVDFLEYRANKVGRTEIAAKRGEVRIDFDYRPLRVEEGWRISTRNVGVTTMLLPYQTVFGFAVVPNRSGLVLISPYWSLLAIAAALAADPWIQWKRQFSLRTLLIVVTLLSIALGTILYLIR